MDRGKQEITQASHGKVAVVEEAVKPRRSFWRRKWTPIDRRAAGGILAVHFLSLLAPFHYNWSAFWLAVVLYVITGLFGITLSYHRNLSHRSFKLPKWLEYLFAYCAVMAMQGDPIEWVSTHRYHHQFVDSERDPHSPIGGFWFSHIGWVLDSYSLTKRVLPENIDEDFHNKKRKLRQNIWIGHVKHGRHNNAGDLEKQAFYRFLRNTYFLHVIALSVLLYAVGGLPFLVWGTGVRAVFFLHATFLVNSACHIWGYQQWKTGDLSKNNWFVALLTFGEGWHNNHHAFEYSARQGLEWWQLDLTWWVVVFLEAIGLATNVKFPSEAQKQMLAKKLDV